MSACKTGPGGPLFLQASHSQCLLALAYGVSKLLPFFTNESDMEPLPACRAMTGEACSTKRGFRPVFLSTISATEKARSELPM